MANDTVACSYIAMAKIVHFHYGRFCIQDDCAVHCTVCGNNIRWQPELNVSGKKYKKKKLEKKMKNNMFASKRMRATRMDDKWTMHKERCLYEVSSHLGSALKRFLYQVASNLVLPLICFLYRVASHLVKFSLNPLFVPRSVGFSLA